MCHFAEEVLWGVFRAFLPKNKKILEKKLWTAPSAEKKINTGCVRGGKQKNRDSYYTTIFCANKIFDITQSSFIMLEWS